VLFIEMLAAGGIGTTREPCLGRAFGFS
jgi:hypothetical protein